MQIFLRCSKYYVDRKELVNLKFKHKFLYVGFLKLKAPNKKQCKYQHATHFFFAPNKIYPRTFFMYIRYIRKLCILLRRIAQKSDGNRFGNERTNLKNKHLWAVTWMPSVDINYSASLKLNQKRVNSCFFFSLFLFCRDFFFMFKNSFSSIATYILDHIPFMHVLYVWVKFQA